jgi:hypothetical protein
MSEKSPRFLVQPREISHLRLPTPGHSSAMALAAADQLFCQRSLVLPRQDENCVTHPIHFLGLAPLPSPTAGFVAHFLSIVKTRAAPVVGHIELSFFISLATFGAWQESLVYWLDLALAPFFAPRPDLSLSGVVDRLCFFQK